MLFIMINLKIVSTLVPKEHQITALAFVQTLRNLSSIIFQNIAGHKKKLFIRVFHSSHCQLPFVQLCVQKLFLTSSIQIIRKGTPSPECPDNSIKLELFKVNFSTFCFKFSLDFFSLSFRSAFFDYLWSFVN